MPASFAQRPPLQDRGDDVVAVLENVGFDYQILAYARLIG
jgi:hypothetical protein